MPQPAHFEPGKSIEVACAVVGPSGATLRIDSSGTPVDGITVEIPAGALARDVTVKLSYDTGTLTLTKGQASGVYLRVSAESVKEFREPIRINIRFDPVRWKGYAVAGYGVDAQGRLEAVDAGPKDYDKGVASFTTLVPLLFTWVYAETR